MSHSESNLPYLGALALGLVVACPFAALLLDNGNGFGLLVLLAGPIISVILFGLARRGKTPEETEIDEPDNPQRTKPSDVAAKTEPKSSRLQRASLALVALIAAISIGLIAGLIFASQAHPLDKASIVVQLTFLGTVAGVIVAAALLVSSGFE